MKNSFNRKFSYLLVFTLLVFLYSSCYNDKQDLITGTWEMTGYRINHFDEHDEIKVTWRFGKEGDFHQLIKYPGYEASETAVWTRKDEQFIQISYTASDNEVEWMIIHLDDSILQIQHTTPGFFVERSFKKQ